MIARKIQTLVVIESVRILLFTLGVLLRNRIFHGLPLLAVLELLISWCLPKGPTVSRVCGVAIPRTRELVQAIRTHRKA
jgi:hypothetical protein